MQGYYSPLGKRERNKQDKLERIIDVATELFGEYGVENVTIHQITERAQIGKGTLFLYARNKGELVLLVQNAHYAAAVERGARLAAHESGTLRALEAFIREIIECNRIRVDNGRNYLREILFGSENDPQRTEALDIVGRANLAVANILDPTATDPTAALHRAQMISHTMFMTLALVENTHMDNDEITGEIMHKAALLTQPSDGNATSPPT